MKRRNVISFAVIFSVGIAFAVAEEPADENMRKETVYLFGNSPGFEGTKIYTPSFVYDTAGNDADDMTLFGYNGFAGIGSGRNRDSDGLQNDGADETIRDASNPADSPEPPPQEEGDPAKDETAARTPPGDADENGMRHIYDFSVPFDGSIAESAGFTGRDGRDDPLVIFEVIPSVPDNILLSDNASFTFLSFDKNAFTNDQSGAKIVSGDSYAEIGNKETIFDIISSLFTIPFTLLSIAFCSGLILVMLTSSGKNSNN